MKYMLPLFYVLPKFIFTEIYLPCLVTAAELNQH